MAGETPWRLEIRHATGFRYESDVTASHNEVRLSPLQTDRQWVMEHRVDVTPAARLARFTDYWGTTVHAFDIRRPHRELSVIATTMVDAGPAPTEVERGVSWAELSDPDRQDEWCEYLMPTRYTEADDAIAGRAEAVRSASSPTNAVEMADALVREVLEYRKGLTTVETTAAEALAGGAGVCQDFVHLALSLLRRSGIPCRYVSGYLSPRAGAVVGETVEGESHAWLDAWVGGWLAIDPTNGRAVGPDHVAVARGRDYADVPPLRGIYHGGRAETLEVTVQVTRRA
jgi:transglutaminase-like putative cysteine protease